MSQTGLRRVLLVDDSDDDASQIERELVRAGIASESRRVENPRALRHALQDFAPHVVLVDHASPPFTAQDALALIRDDQPETPVVIVTGWLNGEGVADYMRAGATDYVDKQRLFRLGPAVRGALAHRESREKELAAAATRARDDERTRKLLERASDAITLLSADGHITHSTGAVTPTLGYEAGELTGRYVFEIVHPDDRAHAQALLAEALQDRHAVVRSTLRVRHKDGSWRYLDVVGSNHLGDPELDAVVVRYHDLTARTRAEASARAIEEHRHQTKRMEAIHRLATKVAHDFNNLLGVIRISCDIALLAVDESDTRVRFELETIANATKRGARLTRELISSTLHEPVARQRVELNGFIARMIDMLRLSVGEDIAVDFEPAASLGMAWVDPAELERVVTALAVHASEAMPGGGLLTLATGDVDVDEALAEAHGVKPGPYVHLAMRYPASTREREDTDAGLGLAEIERVVERWGGFVRFDGEVGRGSTFHLFLPWQP